MLKALKRKTMVSSMLTALVLAVILVVGGIKFLPDVINLAKGPVYFDPLEKNDISHLKGSYLEADVDTLMDYYAETVRSESGKPRTIASREYLMPINQTMAEPFILV